MRAGTKVPSTVEPLPDEIGAAEAQQILGISRTALHARAQSGKLSGRLVDELGRAPHWLFKRVDVERFRDTDPVVKYRKKHHIRKRETWKSNFGSIPHGFTVACRDGDERNVDPANLCLLPLAFRDRRRQATVKSAHGLRPPRMEWTQERVDLLKESFATCRTIDLASSLGVSTHAVRVKARRLRLRKNRDFLRQEARRANRLPIGTERVKEHTGILWVKVALTGSQYEQWRPKHHLVWEGTTGQRVPKDGCVVFRDGNKRNFDPDNLELTTKREVSAAGFARYLALPAVMQSTIKLAGKFQRQIAQKMNGEAPLEKPKRRAQRPGTSIEWTTEMDQAIRDGYPNRPVAELLAELKISEPSLRNRAKRLKVRRSPEAIIAQAREAVRQQKSGQQGVHREQ